MAEPGAGEAQKPIDQQLRELRQKKYDVKYPWDPAVEGKKEAELEAKQRGESANELTDEEIRGLGRQGKAGIKGEPPLTRQEQAAVISAQAKTTAAKGPTAQGPTTSRR